METAGRRDTPGQARTSEGAAHRRRTNPFRENIDPRFLWLGPPHGDALAGLRAAVEKGGLLLLTGDIGTGKTLLANAVADSLRAEGARVAKLVYTDLRPYEFRSEVAREFALSVGGATRGEFLARCDDFLRAARARRERILLVLDEAQDLDGALLDEIDHLARVGREVGEGEGNAISILLVSQTDADALRRWCESHGGEDIIAHRCHLTPLEPQHVCDYVASRLRVAGADHEVFSADAGREIARVSGGVPRLINRICDSALLVASGQREGVVSAETVTDALDDSRGGEPTPPTGRPWRARRGSRWITYAAVLVLAIGLGAAVYHTWSATNARNDGRQSEGEPAPGGRGDPNGGRPATMDGGERGALPELPERTPSAPASGPAAVGTTRPPELPDRDPSVPGGRQEAPGAARQPELPGRGPSVPAGRREGASTTRPPAAKGAEEPDPAAVIDWLLQRRRSGAAR